MNCEQFSFFLSVINRWIFVYNHCQLLLYNNAYCICNMHACHSLIELQKRQLRILKRYNTISFPWTFRRDILDTLRAVLCCAVLCCAALRSSKKLKLLQRMHGLLALLLPNNFAVFDSWARSSNLPRLLTKVRLCLARCLLHINSYANKKKCLSKAGFKFKHKYFFQLLNYTLLALNYCEDN